MTTKIKQFYSYVEKHPKQFFIYGMIFLSVSYFRMLIQGVFFPKKAEQSFKIPILYSKSDIEKGKITAKEKKIDKIMNELKLYQEKSKNNALTKEDTLRMNYLYNQYKNLKNGF